MRRQRGAKRRGAFSPPLVTTIGGPGGGVFQGTEADLLHSDIEEYRSWLLEGARGSPPSDEEREIAFWI